ncbi:hypothetical protein AURANDRAFT_64024 [Aureococcus anophagefferens]|uniref:Uncharacterized protein n=1 Tax=Aureococcus anophagefferens TaxID=44056 RepID=F0Y8M0_AURAN|nr:hypothetical protein AURANDRAFT_64024 [Aureococcus anophagefferens]EGB08632.1 hypothetical protein AURANDRAFT_64024 [Aureococcus anophagefferens]|eukprot:XP_009036627.1 hypothetical protein AURANDRAFT_64024 [Aureococcus anophagefferens]
MCRAAALLLTCGAAAALRLPRPRVAPLVALPSPRAIDVSTRVAGLVTAGFEFFEDVESIGHHHSLGLLCASRLARDAAGATEVVEGLDVGRGRRRRVLEAITSKACTRIVMAVALLAAGKEVLEDLAPGGHHGMVLLRAGKECEIPNFKGSYLGRFPLVLLAVNEFAETLEGALKGRLGRLFDNVIVKLAVPLAAVACAAVEVVADVGKIGAHHGVFILALSKFVKVAGSLAGRLHAGPEARAPGPPAKWAWSGPVFD